MTSSVAQVVMESWRTYTSPQWSPALEWRLELQQQLLTGADAWTSGQNYSKYDGISLIHKGSYMIIYDI